MGKNEALYIIIHITCINNIFKTKTLTKSHKTPTNTLLAVETNIVKNIQKPRPFQGFWKT